MGQFSYKAVNRAGGYITGSIEAADRRSPPQARHRRGAGEDGPPDVRRAVFEDWFAKDYRQGHSGYDQPVRHGFASGTSAAEWA